MNEETNPQPVSRLRRMLGNSTVRVLMAGIIVLTGSFATYAAIDPIREMQNLEARFEIAARNATEIAAASNRANEERCVAERDLAAKKLEVSYAGKLTLEIDDIIRLSNKALWDCSPGTGAVNFTENQ